MDLYSSLPRTNSLSRQALSVSAGTYSGFIVCGCVYARKTGCVQVCVFSLFLTGVSLPTVNTSSGKGARELAASSLIQKLQQQNIKSR